MNSTKRIGVVLAGCGFQDGAEINEAVLTLLAIDKAGHASFAFAPDAHQAGVVDHYKKSPAQESRNILAESARIVRGAIRPVSELNIHEIDALIFPGGFGAAKNLCNFATAGADCAVRPEILTIIRDAHAAGIPIGAICISPAILAAAFRGTGVHPVLTIGNDAGTAAALEKMGARHKNCNVRDCVVDESCKIVTTPAYMYPARLSEAAEGIEKLVHAVVRLATRT